MTEKTEGKAFRLIEMYDSMKDAIDNAKKVKAQQEELTELIESSEKAEKFKPFIEELKQQANDIGNQIETLEKRLAALDFVNCYADKEIIEKLIEALGLFE